MRSSRKDIGSTKASRQEEPGEGGLLQQARAEGVLYADAMQQADALDPIDRMTAALYRSLLHPTMKRIASRAKIAAVLKRYAAEAEHQAPGGGLLGEDEGVSPSQIVEGALRDRDRSVQEPVPRGQRAGEAALAAEPRVAYQKRTGGEEPGAPRGREPSVDESEARRLKPREAEALPREYAEAAAAKPAFDAEVRRIASMVGGTPKTPALKGSKRAIDKILDDYGGDASRIKDLLRATIVVPSAEDARAAAAEIEKSMNVLPESRRSIDEPTEDGYRDVKLNVRLGPDLVAEIQVSVPEMVEAKREAHPFYEEKQEIERVATSQRRSLTEAEREHVNALTAKMRLIYSAAWDRASARSVGRLGSSASSDSTNLSNSALETRAPLWSSEEEGKRRPFGTSQAVSQEPQGLDRSRVTGTPSTSKYSTDIRSSKNDMGGTKAPRQEEPEGGLLRRGPGGHPALKGALKRAAATGDVKRGAEAISNRLRLHANLDEAWNKRNPDRGRVPLTADEAREVEDFIDFIGRHLFKDVGFRILARGPDSAMGSFDAASRIVEIYRRAIAQGQLGRTAVHELWHSLEDTLWPADRQAIRKEFLRQREKWLRRNAWARRFIAGDEMREALHGEVARRWLARFGSDSEVRRQVEITGEGTKHPVVETRWTHENYRFSNPSEYWAETMSDRYFDDREIQSARARSVFGHLRDIFRRMVAGLQRLFGRDASGRIYEGFRRGEYEHRRAGAGEGLGDDGVAFARRGLPQPPRQGADLFGPRKWPDLPEVPRAPEERSRGEALPAMPGAAVQPEAARDQAWRGAIPPKARQQPAGDDLFASRAAQSGTPEPGAPGEAAAEDAAEGPGWITRAERFEDMSDAEAQHLIAYLQRMYLSQASRGEPGGATEPGGSPGRDEGGALAAFMPDAHGVDRAAAFIHAMGARDGKEHAVVLSIPDGAPESATAGTTANRVEFPAPKEGPHLILHNHTVALPLSDTDFRAFGVSRDVAMVAAMLPDGTLSAAAPGPLYDRLGGLFARDLVDPVDGHRYSYWNGLASGVQRAIESAVRLRPATLMGEAQEIANEALHRAGVIDYFTDWGPAEGNADVRQQILDAAYRDVKEAIASTGNDALDRPANAPVSVGGLRGISELAAHRAQSGPGGTGWIQLGAESQRGPESGSGAQRRLFDEGRHPGGLSEPRVVGRDAEAARRNLEAVGRATQREIGLPGRAPASLGARLLDDVHKLFSPTSRAGAKPMEHVIRAHQAARARSADQTGHALDQYAWEIGKLPEAEQLAITHRAEAGLPQPTEALSKAIGALRAEQAIWTAKVRSLGGGRLEETIDGYKPTYGKPSSWVFRPAQRTRVGGLPDSTARNPGRASTRLRRCDFPRSGENGRPALPPGLRARMCAWQHQSICRMCWRTDGKDR